VFISCSIIRPRKILITILVRVALGIYLIMKLGVHVYPLTKPTHSQLDSSRNITK
jgi:hypothetical protein